MLADTFETKANLEGLCNDFGGAARAVLNYDSSGMLVGMNGGGTPGITGVEANCSGPGGMG